MRAVYLVPLAVILALNVVVVLALGAVGGRALVAEWKALAEVAVLRDLLTAKERLSAERGPTNGALGADQADIAAKRQTLRDARLASDAAVEQAIIAVGKNTTSSESGAPIAALRSLQDQTQQARARVDELLAEPKDGRSFARIDTAVHGMTALMPPLSPIIAHVAANIVAADPTLAPLIGVARNAADLRDQAGRIGSMFTASIVTQLPFTVSQIGEIRRNQGWVDELHHGLAEGAAIIADTAASEERDRSAIDRMLATMERRYFGEAQALLDDVIRVGLDNGGFGLTAAQFAGAYVPAMGTIIDVRDAALNEAQRAARINIGRRQAQFALAASIGLLSFAIVAWAVLALRRCVIDPLLALASQVRRLAAGDRHAPIGTATQNGEIAVLATAIEDLRRSALKLSEIDAREAAVQARRSDILREIEGPLARLQAGAASLCERAQASVDRLLVSAAALSQLGPDGSVHAVQLTGAADCARAEHQSMVRSRQSLLEAIERVRDMSEAGDLTTDNSAALRGHALVLLEIVAMFSRAVGRMNLPAMAAISAVVSDQHRLDAAPLTRTMADETATNAEALGRDVGQLHGAMRDVAAILEQLDRSRLADANLNLEIPRSMRNAEMIAMADSECPSDDPAMLTAA